MFVVNNRLFSVAFCDVIVYCMILLQLRKIQIVGMTWRRLVILKVIYGICLEQQKC